MKLYLDEDVADPVLVRLLQRAGHDVGTPAQTNLRGKDDAVQLSYAIEQDRVCLTGNHDDFLNLHTLILRAQGHHPGIFVIRRDNDPRRDLTPRRTVRAIQNLESSGVPIANSFHILNHWR